MFMKDKRLACILRLDWNERYLPSHRNVLSTLYYCLLSTMYLFDSMQACLPVLLWKLTYQRHEAESSKVPCHYSHFPPLFRHSRLYGLFGFFIFLPFYLLVLSGPLLNKYMYILNSLTSYNAFIAINCDRGGKVAFPQRRGIITNQLSTPGLLATLFVQGPTWVSMLNIPYP